MKKPKKIFSEQDMNIHPEYGEILDSYFTTSIHDHKRNCWWFVFVFLILLGIGTYFLLKGGFANILTSVAFFLLLAVSSFTYFLPKQPEKITFYTKGIETPWGFWKKSDVCSYWFLCNDSFNRICFLIREKKLRFTYDLRMDNKSKNFFREILHTLEIKEEKDKKPSFLQYVVALFKL